jgi:TonB-dependent starch-binding outer membrane protein SusC
MNQTNSGSGDQWSLFSVFGRVNYDLMGRYLFEATVRRDGSSRFGKENRYGTFPAASFAWSLSQEDFMAGTRGWLDFMKLRLGWGLSGNDRIGNYNIFSTYGSDLYRASYAITGSNTSTVSGFIPSTVGNPNVTWETTETVNLGLDMTLLNNRFNFGVDVWQRQTSDMLYRLSVPQVMGVATQPFVNIGEMKNTGFDIELGYNNTAMGGQFRYSFTGSISRYVNEVTKLSEDVEEEIIMGGQRQMNYTRATVGTAFPEFYGYVVEGIFQTEAEADAHPAFGDYNAPGRFKYQDTNGDGVITPADMEYIGSPHPDFTGGLNIDLGYGNFDLNMFLYGSYGNDMINYVRRWIDFGMFNGGKSTDALYKSWGSPYLASNADATLPIHDQASGSQQPSTHFIEDGSFLRMKSLRLGYTVPQNVLNRLQIQNIRVYGQVTNLFTITNYSGLDPELNSSGGNMGLDMGAWPTPRQIVFGVTLGL